MAYYYAIRRSDDENASTQTTPRGLQFSGIDDTSTQVTVRLRYLFSRIRFSPILDMRTDENFAFSGNASVQTGGNANSVIASNIDAIEINGVSIPLSNDNQVGDVTPSDWVKFTYSGTSVKSHLSIGHNYASWSADLDVYAIEIIDDNGLHTFTIDGESGLIYDSNTTNPILVNERNAPSDGTQWVYYYDFLNPSDEDTTADNCLKFDGSNDVVETNEHLDIDWSGEDWSIEWLSSKYSNNGTICAQNLSSTGISRELHVYRHSGNTLRFYVYGVNYATSGVIPAQNVVYKLDYVNSTNTWSIYADGVLRDSGTLGSGTATEPTATFTIGARHNGSLTSYGYPAQVDLNYLKVQKGSTVHRFYDFNRTAATAPVVPELINNQNGTMVGFPEPSGYVKDASNELIGYRFNTDTSAKMSTGLPALDGAIDFAIEAMVALDDNFYAVILSKISGNNYNNYIRVTNSEVRFYGINNASRNIFLTSLFADKQLHKLRLERSANGDMALLVDDVPIQTINNSNAKFSALAAEMGAFMSGAANVSSSGTMQSAKIEAPIATIIAQFDFTLGDDDEIINTVGGNNATIINAPTAGYLPIIERQVFTVGSGKDYPDVSVWGQDSQIRNGDFHPVALCYGTQLLTDDVDIHSGFLQEYTIEGATGNFTGDFNDSDIAKITNDPSWTSWLFDERIGQGNFKNIILEAGNNEVFYREAFAGGKFDRVGLTRKTEGQVLSLKTSGTTITLNNCVITNTNFSTGQPVAFFGSGGSPSARRVEIYNSVVYGNTNATYGAARLWNVDAEIYNSVFYNEGTALAITDTLAQGGVSTFTGDNNLSNTADDVQSSTRRGSANELGIGESNFDFTGAFNDSANGDYRILQTYADNNLVGNGWNGSDIGASFYFDGSTPPVTATDTVKVLRGSTIIPAGQTALTLQNGVDYTLEDTDDSKWYFRITNNHFTGMGSTQGVGSQLPDRITAHAVQSGADVILNRPDGTNDNRVDWEIIQYTGNTPENEFAVREKGNITLAAAELTQTVALPASVVNADDVVILIAGQANSSGSTNDANASLFTAVRGASDWVATRGKSNGTANLSYVVIEYTGSDYTVTQESFTASTNVDTHTLVTPVADAAQTFIHAHYRYDTTGAAGLDDASVRVYLQDANTISIRNETSTDLALKQHHVYLIQNPNLTVQRVTGEMAGVGEEEIHGVAITTVANLELSSLGGLSASSTGAGSAFPRGYINFTLENDSSVMLRQSDDGQTSQYAFEVIEWPAGDVGGGGDNNTATIGFTLPTLSFNANGSNSVPVNSFTVGFLLPELVFNIAAGTGVIGNNASLDFVVTSPVFNASGNNTVPVNEVTVNTEIAELTFNGSVVTTAPRSTANVSFSLTDVSITGSASNTVPVNTSSVNIGISLPTFVMQTSVVIGDNNASGQFVLPGLVFTGTGSNTVPKNTTTGSITLPGISITGSGGASGGTNTTNVSIDLGNIGFNATGATTAPIFIAEIDVIISQPSFDIVGSTVIPSSSGSASLSIAAPSFTGTGSNTLPVNASAITFTLGMPGFFLEGLTYLESQLNENIPTITGSFLNTLSISGQTQTMNILGKVKSTNTIAGSTLPILTIRGI